MIALLERPLMVAVLGGMLALLASSAGGAEHGPAGWGSVGPGSANYDCSVDAAVRHGGKYSCRIQSRDPQPDDFAMVTQSFRAAPYRNKRVRLSGYIKTELSGGEGRLWALLNNDEAVLVRDNLGDKAVKGTTDWTKREIVVDVPDTAEYFQIALLVTGKGKAWFDDLKIETVGQEVNLTAPRPTPLPYEQKLPKHDVNAEPANLDFEKGEGTP